MHAWVSPARIHIATILSGEEPVYFHCGYAYGTLDRLIGVIVSKISWKLIRASDLFNKVLLYWLRVMGRPITAELALSGARKKVGRVLGDNSR